MKKAVASKISAVLDARINDLNERGDWRGKALAHVRALIHETDPEIVEEQKWAKATNPDGVPVFSHDGLVCTLETYKNSVKLTFAKGASLNDPAGLFNSSGNVRRAIDIYESDKINEKAFKALVRAAVVLNSQPKSKK